MIGQNSNTTQLPSFGHKPDRVENARLPADQDNVKQTSKKGLIVYRNTITAGKGQWDHYESNMTSSHLRDSTMLLTLFFSHYPRTHKGLQWSFFSPMWFIVLFVLFCFVLFCFALLCFALLCFALLCFCFVLFLFCLFVCFVLFCLFDCAFADGWRGEGGGRG